MPRPYVKVSGVITTDGSFAFGDLTAASELYVMAAKHYLPDIDSYPVYILSGEDKIYSEDGEPDVHDAGHEVPYELWVPTYTPVVLYALIDSDGDNYADLEYELLGVDGAVPLETGTTNVVLDLALTYVP